MDMRYEINFHGITSGVNQGLSDLYWYFIIIIIIIIIIHLLACLLWKKFEKHLTIYQKCFYKNNRYFYNMVVM